MSSFKTPELGKNINIVDGSFKFMLNLLIDKKYSTFKEYIETGQISIDLTNRKGESFLHKSTRKYNRCKFLIKLGINCNLQNNNGETALMFAASNFNDKSLEKIVELLIPYTDCNITNNNGDTALMFAAINTSTERLVESLIQYTDCNIRDGDGRTALMLAVMNGITKKIELLIPCTDCNIRDNDGATALILAAEISDDISMERRTELLIPYTDCNIKDNDGNTALSLYGEQYKNFESDLFGKLVACTTDIDSIKLSNEVYAEAMKLKRKQIKEFESEIGPDLIKMGLPGNVISQILTESGHITALEVGEISRSMDIIFRNERLRKKE